MNKDARPDIDITTNDGQTDIVVCGAMTLAHASDVDHQLSALPGDGDVQIDLSGVTRFDTSAAYLIATLTKQRQHSGTQVHIIGASTETQSLLDSVTAALPDPEHDETPRATFTDWVSSIGEAMAGAGRYVLELVGFLGLFLSGLARSLRRPKEFRITALFHHCEDVGFKAVPIVALMAFLIGVVLAFQGATQLRQFGAEVFVVDLIAISILRELGILLTSIIVAGRTASAFTAAIGSMKMREEIDAMRSLGLDPAMALFIPRILALVIMLPILGLIANVMGLVGGGLMAWVDLGISPAMFVTRLVEGTDISHLMIGMIKAPVFALIIGVIGCHAGMQVKGNAESLGRMTSSAVVASIFAVIVADAMFSIFFAQIGM